MAMLETTLDDFLAFVGSSRMTSYIGLLGRIRQTSLGGSDSVPEKQEALYLEGGQGARRPDRFRSCFAFGTASIEFFLADRCAALAFLQYSGAATGGGRIMTLPILDIIEQQVGAVARGLEQVHYAGSVSSNACSTGSFWRRRSSIHRVVLS